MKTIEEILRSFVETNFLFSADGYAYTDETSFLENGIIDSTGILELVAFIEEQFNISISDSEVIPENFDSINCLSNFIKGKLNPI